MAIDVTQARDIPDPKIAESVVLQRCVSHYRNLYSTAALEALGHTVVNSFHTAWNSSDKLLCSLALKSAGVPTPETHVAFTQEGAMKALGELGYPAVLKPVVGSWGRLAALAQGRGLCQGDHRGQGVHAPQLPGILPPGVREASAARHQDLRHRRQDGRGHLPHLGRATGAPTPRGEERPSPAR